MSVTPSRSIPSPMTSSQPRDAARPCREWATRVRSKLVHVTSSRRRAASTAFSRAGERRYTPRSSKVRPGSVTGMPLIIRTSHLSRSLLSWVRIPSGRCRRGLGMVSSDPRLREPETEQARHRRRSATRRLPGPQPSPPAKTLASYVHGVPAMRNTPGHGLSRRPAATRRRAELARTVDSQHPARVRRASGWTPPPPRCAGQSPSCLPLHERSDRVEGEGFDRGACVLASQPPDRSRSTTRSAGTPSRSS